MINFKVSFLYNIAIVLCLTLGLAASSQVLASTKSVLDTCAIKVTQTQSGHFEIENSLQQHFRASLDSNNDLIVEALGDSLI